MLPLVTPPVFICYDRLDLLTSNGESMILKYLQFCCRIKVLSHQSEYGPSTHQCMYAPPTLTFPYKVIWSVAMSFMQHRGIPAVYFAEQLDHSDLVETKLYCVKSIQAIYPPDAEFGCNASNGYTPNTNRVFMCGNVITPFD